MAQKLASPLLMGPPLCDELVAFVEHLLTEEEAGLVRHFGMFRGRSAPGARGPNTARWTRSSRSCTGCPRRSGSSSRSGADEKSRYRMLPLMPGMFEMVLVRPSLDTLTDWHRRFAELFEALFETGYMRRLSRADDALAAVPAGGQGDRGPSAGAAGGQLEVVLDQFDDLRRRAVPMPHYRRRGRPRLRQAARATAP